MKNIFSKLIKFKTFYVFIFLTILILPSTLFMPSQAKDRAIVTAIGIDKVEDLYEVTLATIAPKNGGQVGGGTMVNSGVGKTVAIAMHYLSMNLGKKLGLQHCDSIILSDSVLLDDVTKVLDYFTRANNLTSDANLINCPKSAKQLIEKGVSSSSTSTLTDIIKYNNEHLYSTNVSIYEFYNRYFSYSGSIYMPIVEVMEDEKIVPSGNDNKNDFSSLFGNDTVSYSSSNSSYNESKSKNVKSSNSGDDKNMSSIFKSNGKCAIIKNGKKIREINEKERVALNMLSKNSNKGIIGVTNFSEGDLKNATIFMQVVNKRFSVTADFKNDKPKIVFNIDMILKLDEVIMNKINENAITGLTSFMSDKLKAELSKNINICVDELITNMKKEKTDILFVYENLNRFHHKELINFLNSLENKNDYLSFVDFSTNIKLRGKI